MNKSTKDDITELFIWLYNVPGQYFIFAMIFFALWKTMQFTNFSIIFLIFGVFCLIVEIISPILAGKRLYLKALNNIKRFFH